MEGRQAVAGGVHGGSGVRTLSQYSFSTTLGGGDLTVARHALDGDPACRARPPVGKRLTLTSDQFKGADRIQIDTAYFTQTFKRYDTIRYSSLLLPNRYDTISYQHDPNLRQNL